MSNESSINKLYQALDALKGEPETKINPNIVAKRAGVNRANLYKETEQAKALLKDIKYASEIRTYEVRVSQLEYTISKQKKEIDKLKESKKQIKEITSDDGEWMSHLTEMYRVNDNLSSRQADLENQISHNNTSTTLAVDPSTGEVIEGIFDNNNNN